MKHGFFNSYFDGGHIQNHKNKNWAHWPLQEEMLPPELIVPTPVEIKEGVDLVFDPKMPKEEMKALLEKTYEDGKDIIGT